MHVLPLETLIRAQDAKLIVSVHPVHFHVSRVLVIIAVVCFIGFVCFIRHPGVEEVSSSFIIEGVTLLDDFSTK